MPNLCRSGDDQAVREAWRLKSAADPNTDRLQVFAAVCRMYSRIRKSAWFQADWS